MSPGPEGMALGQSVLIAERDQELYRALADHSFEVQVGLHELLGHGSGRLLREEADGKFNFDRAKVVSTVDNKPVTSRVQAGRDLGL